MTNELEELRREIEARLVKTKSRSVFRDSFNSDVIDTDALSECSSSMLSENNEALNETNETHIVPTLDDAVISTLDCDARKDSPVEENASSLTGDKENEEISKEIMNNDEINEHVIENNEDEPVEKGVEFSCLMASVLHLGSYTFIC